ncbi:MAG: glycoside hydrolase family 32 protein [Lachnospiraceae bacterium]
MNSQLLLEARQYEKTAGEKIPAIQRPIFHITPWVGWLNDPNGFSIYKGEYHLFYQYYPYDISWGPMHWGHVKSKDFIKWDRLPAAIGPDMEYDVSGCFSGSAVELTDGRQLLMYTGVKGVDNTESYRQTQCLAYGDGVDYEKYEGNPVLTVKNLPEGNSARDFRDPKIWYDKKDECYYAVVGNRTADDSGAILMFKSKDSMNWEYVTTLDSCKNEYGKMWECPDFFEIDGKAFILTSPQEMRAKGLEFHNGNDVICLVGDYERETHKFTREKVIPVDLGLDFYAPQTLETEDGRRIMIGWMQSWETTRFHPTKFQWTCQMTLPRELSVRDGKLIQNPVRELSYYHANGVSYEGLKIEEKKEVAGVSGRVLDMTVEVRPSLIESLYDTFRINIAENEEYSTYIEYNPHKNIVEFNRVNSGYRANVVHTRKAFVKDQNGVIKFRIILDRFSVEIFINDGEQVMSAGLYTPLESDGISFEAKGEAWIDIEKYDIVVE